MPQSIQIDQVAAELVGRFLNDRMDLIKLVSSGGSTGNQTLDQALKGVVSAVKTSLWEQNKKYLLILLVLGVLAYLGIKKRFKLW